MKHQGHKLKTKVGRIKHMSVIILKNPELNASSKR